MHVDRRQPAGGQHPAGQLIAGPVAEDLPVRPIALVAHTGDGPVQLEPHEPGPGRRGAQEGDGLAHGDCRLQPPARRSPGGQVEQPGVGVLRGR